MFDDVLSQKDEIERVRRMLEFDPVDEAEKTTGKEYQKDDGTAYLGLALQIESHRAKENYLRKHGDSYFGIGHQEYLKIVSDAGFETLLEETFINTDMTAHDKYYVMWNNQHGILLAFDTYGKNLNGGHYYYNWEPANIKTYYNHTSSGGFAKKLFPEKYVWGGYHDCREAILFYIEDLKRNGTFVVPWVTDPMVHLVRYDEWRKLEEMGRNSSDITLRRLTSFPEHVQSAIAASIAKYQ
jgi:hypothetical protein